MADITTHSHAPALNLGLLAAPFRAVWSFMIAIGEANSKVREIERYQEMSDAQLAELGMTRGDIVHKVFAGRFHH